MDRNRIAVIGFPLLIIRAYRKFVSPWMIPCCRFSPSCSEYAERALKKHGLMKGGTLLLWRLLRCQPLCHGGYDPVPEGK